MKINDLLHRPNDFVAVVRDVSQDGTRVDLVYYKWLPYSWADNAISGMNGWYRVETMEQYLVSPEHPIFKRYGLPPEYVAPTTKYDELSLLIHDTLVDAHHADNMQEIDALTKSLTEYVLGLLK